MASANPTAALVPLRRALALNPQSASAHYFAGLCLAQLGDLGAAVLELEVTLRLDPNHTAARTNLELIRKQISLSPR